MDFCVELPAKRCFNVYFALYCDQYMSQKSLGLVYLHKFRSSAYILRKIIGAIGVYF